MISGASESFAKGRAAMQDGDVTAALRWLEQAHLLAKDNDLIALVLAGARLFVGQGSAVELFEALARKHDLREAWVGLAAGYRLRKQPKGMALAMVQALSRHALPADWDVSVLGEITSATGAPGWCGLSGDGQLVYCLAPGKNTPVQPVIALDGQTLPLLPKSKGAKARTALDLPSSWTRGHFLTVVSGGRHLLGSPMAITDIVRIEGLVTTENGGLQGWAWSPNDPGRPTELIIEERYNEGGPLLAVTAADQAVTIAHPRPLASPRGFFVPAEALVQFNGPVRVRGRDGRELYGSPLDPSAARRSATAAVAAVARLFPAAPQHDPEPPPPVTLPSMPADLTAPPAQGGTRKRPVDIVVPAYRGKDETMACLESVFESLDRWSRVVVVDDHSPDADLRQALDDLAEHGRIHLLRHPANRGFPSAANTGMRYGPGRDVVLLNTDTLVPKGWLKRLRDIAYAAGDIGSVTPLSNDASILSYPSTEHPNPVPDLAETQRLDALAEQANGGVSVDIPTAVGFCMYIRRECLDAVGVLREDVFAQGYGEENDFCLRARHAGWRHVAAPGVFVAHHGGQSFGPAKTYLMERNLKILNGLHPGYTALIEAFQQADPLAESRRRLDMARWRRAPARRGSVLLITHGRSGGVQTRIAVRAAALRAEGLRPIVISPAEQDDTCVLRDGLEGTTPNLRFKVPDELDFLAAFLGPDRPIRAEVHSLLGHDHRLLELVPRLGISYDMVVHDYASFCPRIALVTGSRRYCGEPDIAGCEACIADNGSDLGEDIPLRALLARSRHELGRAEQVIVPSSDVAARLRRHFPALHSTVVPWEPEPGPAKRATRPQGAPARICVVGAIGIEKGYDVLLGCARDAAARNLALEFVLVGYSMDNLRLLETGRVRLTGSYEEANAVSLIRAQEADIGFIGSVCPETWSYTLTQLWQGGLDVAAFDLGAPAERISRAQRGWLIPFGLGVGAVNNALLQFVRLARNPAAPGGNVTRLGDGAAVELRRRGGA